MKNKIIFCSILLLTSINSGAMEKAITESGKNITIFDNGSWLLDENTKNKITNKNNYSSNAQTNGFRGMDWGNSKEFIIQNEKLELKVKKENSIAYGGEISGSKFIIAYLFTSNNKLSRGKYISMENHSNKNKFISDFENLKEILTKKYGKPLEDNEIWFNDLYKNSYEDWGMAISVGHLSYSSRWETSDSGIVILLDGNNFKTRLAVEYTSNEFYPLESKEIEKKELSNF